MDVQIVLVVLSLQSKYCAVSLQAPYSCEYVLAFLKCVMLHLNYEGDYAAPHLLTLQNLSHDIGPSPRKRYENASVDVKLCYNFREMKKEVFENLLMWTWPKDIKILAARLKESIKEIPWKG